MIHFHFKDKGRSENHFKVNVLGEGEEIIRMTPLVTSIGSI